MHVIVEIMLLRYSKAFMLESEQATKPSHPEIRKIRDQLGTHTQKGLFEQFSLLRWFNNLAGP